MAATTTDDLSNPTAPTGAQRLSPLDWTLDLTRLGWETLAWLGLVPVALLLRVIWLHAWPLAGNEATLGSAMWALLTRGQATIAPPAEVGPAPALLGSFWLFLFGVSDDIARLGPALAGAATVAACWWLRPFLGRAAALTAATLLTFSPLALYESRRLVAEPYAILGLLVLAIALLRLQAGSGRGSLLVATAAGVLASLSHYLALPVALLLIGAVPLARRLATSGNQMAPDGAALPGARLVRADWLAAGALGLGLVLLVGLLAAGGGEELAATLLSPLTAWFALAPPADRAPLYLPLLLLIYEPLILIGALVSAWTIGNPHETPTQRLTGLLLVLWATVALVLAAFGGDRDPAQVLYPLIPLALLAGRVFGLLANAIPWATYRRQRGPLLTAASALTIIALVVFLATVTGPTSGAAAAYAVQVLLDFILFLGLLGATIYLARPFGPRDGARIVGVTLLAILALYTVRSATQLSFVQPAAASELAVQAQTAPGVTSIVERINRLSRDLTGLRRTEADVTGGHGLEIAIDQAAQEPFDWYLRDYYQRTVFDPTTGALPGNPQLVIVTASGETPLRALLERGYVGQRYPLVWSFPPGGLGGGGISGLVRYLLYREPAVAPAPQEFTLYLRRDVADRVLFAGGAAASAPATQAPVNLFDQAGRGRAPGQFDSPRGIVVDGQGNIYVVDTVNARVQKFNAAGEHQWSSGSTGTGPGQFGRIQNGPGPTGIAVDAQGMIYVADTWNHRIVKLDPQGKFVTSWGNFFNTQGNQDMGQQHPREFFGPRSIAIGPDGALYVTDTGNKRILVFDAEGRPLRQWGGLGSGPANLSEPVGIAIDGTSVYVADTYNARIARFDLQGQPLGQWSVPGWGANIYQEPYIAIAGDRVYVTSGPGRSLLTFDKQSGQLLSEERRVGGHDLVNPTGLAVAPDGRLLLVDTAAHAVLRVTPGRATP